MSGIIVDIDGTLLSGNNGIQPTIDYVNKKANQYDIFVVTGRPESARANTTEALKSNGVKFKRLYMKSKSSDDSIAHKKEVGESLQSKQTIILAIDNDTKARDAYRSLGIKVLAPSIIRVVHRTKI